MSLATLLADPVDRALMAEPTVRLHKGMSGAAAHRLSRAPMVTQECGTCEAPEEEAPTGYEELACCNVCNEGDWEDDDQIIFCDSCDLAVHQV